MDNLFSKIIKIPNYLDQKGLYEESDFLENKLIKIAVAPPRPTMPPSNHPIMRATSSIEVLTRPIRIPVLSFNPVIKPSRGPGPTLQVM